jgi:hypothetical protein
MVVLSRLTQTNCYNHNLYTLVTLIVEKKKRVVMFNCRGSIQQTDEELKCNERSSYIRNTIEEL